MDSALYRDHGAMEEDHWWFRGRRRVVHDVLARHLRRQPAPAGGRRLLDVGCGTGGMLPMLAEFGAVTGMDMSEQAVELCRQRYGTRVQARVGGIPDGLPEPGTLDVVSAFDVIEHIDDDLAAVRALHDALRPGGSLVVTVPAHMYLWSEHDDLNHHKRRYRRDELERVLTRGGFRVELISYYNSWLFPVVALVRWRRKNAQDQRGRSDFDMPSKPVNALLARLFASERFVLRRAPLPVGVSLVAVAVKPDVEAGFGAPAA